MTLKDYERVYNLVELRNVWKEFFRKQVLYRNLMVSRTEKSYRKIYVYFIKAFRKAFELKRFKGLNVLMSKKEKRINHELTSKKCSSTI